MSSITVAFGNGGTRLGYWELCLAGRRSYAMRFKAWPETRMRDTWSVCDGHTVEFRPVLGPTEPMAPADEERLIAAMTVHDERVAQANREFAAVFDRLGMSTQPDPQSQPDA